MRLILLAMTMLTSAAPASAADQFDLVCRHEKGETRYRVDLARNEACVGSCDRVWKMGASTSGELKLMDKVPNLRGDLEERATVNRSTGDYSYFVRLPGFTETEKGRCEVAPFSGFPAARF